MTDAKPTPDLSTTAGKIADLQHR
ncbi:MAG: hypothetical protein RIT51_105, partial [Actinomycetota bacterium]